MIEWNHYELKLILEEVAKLPRTTDTSHVPPDVVELVDERLFDYEALKCAKIFFDFTWKDV